jgi:hypothetical protein
MSQTKNTKTNADIERETLAEDLAHQGIKLGFAVVQHVAAETLKHKPGCSVIEFVQILDRYQKDMEAQRNKTIDITATSQE